MTQQLWRIFEVLPGLLLLLVLLLFSLPLFLIGIAIPLDALQKFLEYLSTRKWSNNKIFISLFRFYSLFCSHLIKEIFENHVSGFLLTYKRIFVLLILLLGIPCLITWQHLGFLLDDLLFPRWRDRPVDKTCFIVGNARSGTTWMHRLLAENEEIFTTIRTWEILFAVSITWKLLLKGLCFLDCFLFRGILWDLIDRIERKVVGDLRVHRVGLMEAEEDEWLMTHIGMSQLASFFFPMAINFPLVFFDDDNDSFKFKQLSLKVRFEIMGYYKDCVRKHLFTHDLINPQRPRPVFLSKNPAFSMRLCTLRELFPRARVIYMLRDPREATSSLTSYLGLVWKAFASPTRANSRPNSHSLVEFSIRHYLFPHKELAKFPECQVSVLSYARLCRSLKPCVLDLLHHLGLYSTVIEAGTEPEGRLIERLHNEQVRTLCYVSSHVHSAEECFGGADPASGLFSEVFAAWRHHLELAVDGIFSDK